MWNWFESDQGQYRSFRIEGVKEFSHYIICYNWKDMMRYDMVTPLVGIMAMSSNDSSEWSDYFKIIMTLYATLYAILSSNRF